MKFPIEVFKFPPDHTKLLLKLPVNEVMLGIPHTNELLDPLGNVVLLTASSPNKINVLVVSSLCAIPPELGVAHSNLPLASVVNVLLAVFVNPAPSIIFKFGFSPATLLLSTDNVV